MGLINEVDSLLTIGIIVFFVLIGIMGLVYIYFFRIKKVLSIEQNINYDKFDKRSTLEYVKFQDILTSGLVEPDPEDKDSLTDIGMVCMGNGRFVAGINIVGYDYHDASEDEKASTIANMIGFTGLIGEDGVQVRQNASAYDISYNKDVFAEIMKNKKRVAYNLKEDYEELLRHAEDSVDDDIEFHSTTKKLDELKLKIRGEEFLLGVSKGLNSYLDLMSGKGTSSQRDHTMMFSFRYNPDKYNTDMSDIEIKLTALRALKSKASSYMQALESTGCTCSQMSAIELMSAVRKHFHPSTADDFTVKDLLNSSYTGLFVDSESLKEIEREKIGNERYRRDVEEYKAYMQEKLKKEKMQLDRAAAHEIDTATQGAMEEIRAMR